MYILGRNEALFDSAVERLAAETPPVTAKPHFIHLDLSSLRSPLAAAKELSAKENKFHALWCSAGVMVPPVGSKTDEGYELQWHTNVMGHWQLVTALLPILQKVAEQSEGREKARVVHTSSSGHRFAPSGGVDWESLKVGEDGSVGNGLNKWALYGQVSLLLSCFHPTPVRANTVVEQAREHHRRERTGPSVRRHHHLDFLQPGQYVPSLHLPRPSHQLTTKCLQI